MQVAKEAERIRVAEAQRRESRAAREEEERRRAALHVFTEIAPAPKEDRRRRATRGAKKLDDATVHVLFSDPEEGEGHFRFYAGITGHSRAKKDIYIAGRPSSSFNKTLVLANALYGMLLRAPPSNIKIRTNHSELRLHLVGRPPNHDSSLDTSIFSKIHDRLADLCGSGAVSASNCPSTSEVTINGGPLDPLAFNCLETTDLALNQAGAFPPSPSTTPSLMSFLPSNFRALAPEVMSRADTFGPSTGNSGAVRSPTPLIPTTLHIPLGEKLYNFGGVEKVGDETKIKLISADSASCAVLVNVYVFRDMIRALLLPLDSPSPSNHPPPSDLCVLYDRLADPLDSRLPRVGDVIYRQEQDVRLAYTVTGTSYRTSDLSHGNFTVAIVAHVNNIELSVILSKSLRTPLYDKMTEGTWHMPRNFADHRADSATNGEPAQRLMNCPQCNDDILCYDRIRHVQVHLSAGEGNEDMFKEAFKISSCHQCLSWFATPAVSTRHAETCSHRALDCPVENCPASFARNAGDQRLHEHLRANHPALDDPLLLAKVGLHKCNEACCAEKSSPLLRYHPPDHAFERNVDASTARASTEFLNNPTHLKPVSDLETWLSHSKDENDKGRRVHEAGSLKQLELGKLPRDLRIRIFETFNKLMQEVTLATRAGETVSDAWFFILLNFDMIILADAPDKPIRERAKQGRRVQERLKMFREGHAFELFQDYYEADPIPRNNRPPRDLEASRRAKRMLVERQARDGLIADAAKTLKNKEKRLDMADPVLQKMFEAKLSPPPPPSSDPAATAARAEALSALTTEENPAATDVPSSLFAVTSNPGYYDNERDEEDAAHPDSRPRSEKIERATEKLRRCLHRTKKGKAPGVFGDSMDIWRAFGLFETQGSRADETPYLHSLADFLLLFLEGLVPTSLSHHFTVARPAAFNKNTTGEGGIKVRPIGIPSALRRVLGKFVMALNLPSICKLLTGLGQYAIGTKNGAGFIVELVAAVHEATIDRSDSTTPAPWFEEGELEDLPDDWKKTFMESEQDVRSRRPAFRDGVATAALDSEDATSMFNLVNSDEVIRVLSKHPELKAFMSYVNFCYPKGQKRWYCGSHSDGFWRIAQLLGFIQGDPIAPVLASIIEAYVRAELVGTHVKKHIAAYDANPPSRDPHTPTTSFADYAAFLSHRRQRKAQPSECFSVAYMDDATWMNSYQVHVVAMRRFRLLAPSYGIYLNPDKAAFLLGDVDKSWREYHPDTGTFGAHTFSELLSNEFQASTDAITGKAIKLLGNAIGVRNARAPILSKIMQQKKEQVNLLEDFDISFDTALTITRFCFVGSLNHILASAREEDEARDLAGDASAIMQGAVAYLTQTETTAPRFSKSFEEMTLPNEYGGSGLADPQNEYKAVLVARRLLLLSAGARAWEESGILLSGGGNPRGEPLPKSTHDFLRDLLPPTSEPDNVDGLPPFVVHTAGLLKQIVPDEAFRTRTEWGDSPKLQHELNVRRAKAQVNEIMSNAATDDLRTYNRRLSIMQKGSGSTFQQLDQTRKVSEYSRLDFMYRYGMPLFPFSEPTNCPLCKEKNAFDCYGDHVFCCKVLVRSQRARLLHNPIRDAMAITLNRLSYITGSPLARNTTRTEPVGLLADKPDLVRAASKRPADIIVHLNKRSALNMCNSEREVLHVDRIALDVKTTHGNTNRPLTTDRPTYDCNNAPRPSDFAHLITAENNANKGARGYGGDVAKYLASTGVGYLPLAIDTFGALGSAACGLLHGGTYASTSTNSSKHYARPNGVINSHYQEAGFSYEPGRDPRPAPPFLPSASMGLIPKLSETVGVAGRWWRRALGNAIEQDIDTERSQGVGASLHYAQALVRAARHAFSGNPVGTHASTSQRTADPPPEIPYEVLCAMRGVWGAHAPHPPDTSDSDTATVADTASTVSQDGDRSTTLNASQASSYTESPTDANCIIARSTAPGGGGGEPGDSSLGNEYGQGT